MSSGGLRRYTEELAQALGSDTVVLRPNGRFWWSLQLPWHLSRMGFDVFHGTNFEVPYLPVCPSVMTIHDLSPWRYPQWHHAADRVRLRTPALLRLGLATMVITDTEAVRRDVIAEWRISPSQVVAIPIAAATHLRPSGASMANYFLFVGTVEPRKNVPALIAAWRIVRRRFDVELWIAGRHRADAPSLAEEPGLRVLGEVGEADLADLYSQAVAVVYPSHYEGFGLPVLEAMQCGAPVIASEDAALVEVSGGAALHGNMVEEMEALLSKPELRASLVTASLRRAADFSWAKTATLTRAVYGEAIERWRA